MSIKIVAQCVDRALLLVDNVSRFVSIEHGVVIYLSFLNNANDAAVDAAVKALLSTRIFKLGVTTASTAFASPAPLSTGTCNDESSGPPPAASSALPPGPSSASSSSSPASSPQSRRERAYALTEVEADVLIVPQATLAGRIKGKTVQYHAQAEKDEGLRLYQRFCNGLRAALMPEYPPEAFDPNGILLSESPLCATAGEVGGEAGVSVPASPPRARGRRLVLNGSYGNRQGLTLEAYGPFTHAFDF